jgi:N-acetylmuramoyl-L-alanine amidase
VKIDVLHWLEGAIRREIVGGSPMPVRRFLVIHFTSGATAESSVNFWKTPAAKGASAHIVIDRDGTVYQCRPFNRTCGHAGVSRWKNYSNLNSCSIGIELANAGDNERLTERWSKYQPIEARHKNGGPLKKWEAYTMPQLGAVEEVAKALVARYKLDDLVGHDDIAPSRKVDPGPAFPMAALRAACGFPAEIIP